MNAGFAHFLAPIVAGSIAITIMLLLLRTDSLALDRPNRRSLHSVAVPRTGGIAIMTGVLAAAFLLCADVGIVAPTLVLAILSYLDDRYQLPTFGRMAAHLIVAGAFVWASGLPVNPVIAVALILALGWFTNLYNFMDGSDGLAGGMTVIGFLCYGMAAWLAGVDDLSLFSLSVATAAAGFLIYNFPPARIFMGDVGSIPLGFLAGAVGLAGGQQGVWPFWFPLLVFAPFIVDASITLLRRTLAGERIWQAHRQHYYQRLILSGWSHRKTAFSEYALMLICSTAAILCLRASPATQWTLVGILTAVFAVAMLAIDHRWQQFSAGARD